MSFTHLHLHTEYSLLDGSGHIKEVVSRVKELGMDSVAITDHGVMYGVIDFYKECKKQGVKPIIGCEVYLAPGSRTDRDRQGGYYHLVLLAENETGFHNLMKLVSIGYTEGYYYKPRIDKEALKQYAEGLIGLSACLAGEVQRRGLQGGYEEAKAAALSYREILGKDNFYLEIQDHGMTDQKRVIAQNVRLAEETGIPLVCTNDCHYVYEDDEQAHDILLCIQTGKKLQDENRMRYPGGQFFIKSEAEMRALFPEHPEAVDNTAAIAARCTVDIAFGELKLPHFHIETGEAPFDYLERLCYEGLARKYKAPGELHRERLAYELDVIRNMGYVDYFLIVRDFIHYAKRNDIMVGPGRGSAAGSLVSYTLDITEIDPLAFDLLFERFLNPERVSMPDIDVDFCYERRQEVIDYVIRRYGEESVVQIITFGTMAARAVIRDVGRVMDLPYNRVDRVAKMIPTDLGITIDKALKMQAELREMAEKEPDIAYLIKMARRLEGLPRHASVHAAGVVISEKPITEYVPVSRGSDGVVTTQFPMGTLEELGLLKMDFLGLRTLTVIRDAIRMVASGGGPRVDFQTMGMDDPDVYRMISAGDTTGVFQLESAGMRAFMKELRPDNLEDIIAGLSLYRPGPMDFIPTYCRRKHGMEPVVYETPELAEILDTTYGCIVYQEQVMQIVRRLAGYTLGRSDLLRRAMSKKKSDVMMQERHNFIYGNEKEGIQGCVNNGIDEKVAGAIYDEMLDFAKYAFNKSHAAAYAVLSYQTAYLKCHHPVEYMAAIMTSFIDNAMKVTEYIEACKGMQIDLAAPDINDGHRDFTVRGKHIIFALSAVKNVGRRIIDLIVAERTARGRFTDLRDFIMRTAPQGVNKRVVESLIKAGALDGLPGNRREKLFAYQDIMAEEMAGRKGQISGQMSLMDFLSEEECPTETLTAMPEFPKEELLDFEKEMLGVYVSGHPLEFFKEEMERIADITTLDIANMSTADLEARAYDTVTIGGVIRTVRELTTKSNRRMAFVTLEDRFSVIEAVVFPEIFDRTRDLLTAGMKVFIRGNIQTDENRPPNIIVREVYDMTKVKKVLWVSFPQKSAYDEPALRTLLAEHPGGNAVNVWIVQERLLKTLTDCSVEASEALLAELVARYGADNVKVVSSIG